MNSRKRNIYVGLFVIIGTLIIASALLLIGDINDTFSSKMEVHTTFDDVDGLQKGDNVWFSGVKVGTVSKLQFNKHSQVEITMKIETSAKDYIPSDAKVKLGSDGLIGNRILVIHGGTNNKHCIEAGGNFIAVKTISTEEMMNTLQLNNKNILEITESTKILIKNISEGQGTLGKLFTDDELYGNFNQVAISIQSAMFKANKSIENIELFSEKLNNEGNFVNDLLTDTLLYSSLSTSVTELNNIVNNTSTLVTGLKSDFENPNSSIGVLLRNDSTGQQIQTTINNLEYSSEKLVEDLNALEQSFLLRRYFKKKNKRND